jgi:gentisate 1,2-dioxygenase
MQKTILYCDKYGTEGALPVLFWTGRGTDAAGSVEDTYEEIDLSHKAAMEVLHALESTIPKVQADPWRIKWNKLLESLRK